MSTHLLTMKINQWACKNFCGYRKKLIEYLGLNGTWSNAIKPHSISTPLCCKWSKRSTKHNCYWPQSRMFMLVNGALPGHCLYTSFGSGWWYNKTWTRLGIDGGDCQEICTWQTNKTDLSNYKKIFCKSSGAENRQYCRYTNPGQRKLDLAGVNTKL